MNDWLSWGIAWGDSWGNSWGPLHEVDEPRVSGWIVYETSGLRTIKARARVTESEEAVARSTVVLLCSVSEVSTETHRAVGRVVVDRERVNRRNAQALLLLS